MSFMESIPIRERPAPAFGIRGRVEATIETLIEFLDRIDGDEDLENLGLEDDFVLPDFRRLGVGCPLSDPGGEQDRAPLTPIYGIDQSRGPINERAGHAAWLRQRRREDWA